MITAFRIDPEPPEPEPEPEYHGEGLARSGATLPQMLEHMTNLHSDIYIDWLAERYFGSYFADGTPDPWVDRISA